MLVCKMNVAHLSMASRSPLDTDLWKVEWECLVPCESPPSDWNPSSRGSTLPSLAPRPAPPSSEEAKLGTERRRCLLPWDSTSDIARFF